MAAYFLVAMLGRLLPGRDPLVVAGAAVVLVLIALFACRLPARRTTRVDPAVALRAE